MIVLTGSNSGIGAELLKLLKANGEDVLALTRNEFDMDVQTSDISVPKNVKMLINCAGHDLGGKVPFDQHKPEHWVKIINTNLVNAMVLSQKVLQQNLDAMIVNITSTNVDQYYPNDLVYSLSKTALKTFTDYLRIEYPDNVNQFKEVRLSLTRTNFINNRYKDYHASKQDLYAMFPCLEANEAAEQIFDFIQSDKNTIRIAK